MSNIRTRAAVAMVALSLVGLLSPGCADLLPPGTNLPLGSASSQAPTHGGIVFSVSLPDVQRQVSALMDVIDSIDLKVSGSAISSPLTARIAKSQIAGGKASTTFSQVPVGTAILTAEVKDASGSVLASGSANVTVMPGRDTTASLTLSVPTTGSVGADLTIVEATPAPTPTPSPTPTPPPAVTSFSGNGLAGYLDEVANLAKFDYPVGLALGSGGTLYVADANNHRIRKVSSSGTVTTLAGSGQTGYYYGGFADGSSTEAEFHTPLGVAIDSSGNVYVADHDNYRIRKITTDQQVSTLAGHTPGTEDGVGEDARVSPNAITIDSSGNLYVADETSIRKVSLSGNVVTIAGDPSEVGFADGDGAEARFAYTSGIAVDANGYLYVADSGNHAIRKISPTGTVTTLAGNGTEGLVNATGSNARFNYPTDVAVDGSGNVYVADRDNHQIRKVTPSGVVTTYAGSTQGSATGSRLAAKFKAPSALLLGPDGYLYVADSGNNRIRKIDTRL